MRLARFMSAPHAAKPGVAAGTWPERRCGCRQRCSPARLNPVFGGSLNPFTITTMAGRLKTVARAARWGIAWALFWMASQGIGSTFRGDPLEWRRWLWTGLVFVAIFTIGGAVYSLVLPLLGSARRGQRTASVLAGSLAGVITFAPFALLYLRRAPEPGAISHLGFAALTLFGGAFGGAFVALLATQENRRALPRE